MASIFTRIINGEIPCYKVGENENCFAFLDINPVVKGHTLVIPKVEKDYIFDLTDKELTDLILFAKEVATSIKQNLNCKRVAVVVLGMEVPHAHIHLIPINSEKEANLSNPKLSLTPDQFNAIVKLIEI